MGAANGQSERVSVVQRDAGLLERGREVRALGANIAIADLFDAGEAFQCCWSWQQLIAEGP